MKKRMLSLPLSAWFLLALCACGGGSAPTFDLHTETAYTHIDGLYVDTDYQDPEGQDRHMLYLFYTVYTPDQPLSVRSDATQLTVGEGETYSAEHYTGQCRLMPSYYYSSYLQDVSVGTPLAVVETFRIPAEVLTSGQAITLTNAQIPEMDQLILSTEDLVLCQGVEAVAQAADPTGYDRVQALRAEADPETAQQVRQAVNGRAWNCYIDGISYQIAFSQPSDFTLTDQAETVTGTYVVEQGYIACQVHSSSRVVEIPYQWEEDGSIDLDLLSVFDQREG